MSRICPGVWPNVPQGRQAGQVRPDIFEQQLRTKFLFMLISVHCCVRDPASLVGIRHRELRIRHWINSCLEMNSNQPTNFTFNLPEEFSREPSDSNKTPRTTEGTTDRPRLPAAVVPLFEALRRLRIQAHRCQRHIDFLKTCIKDGIVPKGLQTRVNPQLPNFSTQFGISWDQCHVEFGLKLTNLLQNFWTERHEYLTTEIEAIKDQRANQSNYYPGYSRSHLDTYWGSCRKHQTP